MTIQPVRHRGEQSKETSVREGGQRYIQELLGHKDIKTTLIYTHVTTRSLENIQSPLDHLSLTDHSWEKAKR